MVFQKFALLPHRTVLLNADMALEVQGVAEAERNTEGRKWVARVGLDGCESHYPVQLSGGMQDLLLELQKNHTKPSFSSPMIWMRPSNWPITS